MIGISRVASLAASAAGVNQATIRSTLSRTSIRYEFRSDAGQASRLPALAAEPSIDLSETPVSPRRVFLCTAPNAALFDSADDNQRAVARGLRRFTTGYNGVELDQCVGSPPRPT